MPRSWLARSACRRPRGSARRGRAPSGALRPRPSAFHGERPGRIYPACVHAPCRGPLVAQPLLPRRRRMAAVGPGRRVVPLQPPAVPGRPLRACDGQGAAAALLRQERPARASFATNGAGAQPFTVNGAGRRACRGRPIRGPGRHPATDPPAGDMLPRDAFRRMPAHRPGDRERRATAPRGSPPPSGGPSAGARGARDDARSPDEADATPGRFPPLRPGPDSDRSARPPLAPGVFPRGFVGERAIAPRNGPA